MLRVIARNLLSTWVAFAVQVLTAFFLTPFVLHSLGEARYGVWALIIGITGYYGVLDIGLRYGLQHYLCRFLAVGDIEQFNRAASSGLVALSVAAGIVMLGSLPLAWLAPIAFHLDGAIVSEARWIILLVAVQTVCQFILFPFNIVITAAQRFDIANAIGVCTRLVSAGLTYVFLNHGGGLIGLGVIALGTNALDYCLRWWVAYRVVPGLRVAFYDADMNRIWDYLSVGTWTTLTNASSQIIFYSDAIVIGFMLPAAAITRFSIAASLSQYFIHLFYPVGQVLLPVFAGLDAKGAAGTTHVVYLHASRFTATLATAVSMLAMCWAGDFYRLWIGDEAFSADYPAAGTLFRVLMLGSFFVSVRRIGSQVLLGANKARTIALLLAAEGIVNLSLSIALVPWLGLAAVALGTAIPAVVFQGIVHPYFVARQLGMPLRVYYFSTYGRPLLVAICACPLLVALKALGSPQNWLMFFFQGTAAFAVTLTVVFAVGMGSSERRQFVLRPLSRLLAFLARREADDLWGEPLEARKAFSGREHGIASSGALNGIVEAIEQGA